MPNDLNAAASLRALILGMGERARVASRAMARANTAA